MVEQHDPSCVALGPLLFHRLTVSVSISSLLVASGSEFQTLVPPVVSQLCVPAGVNFTRKGLLVSDAAAGGCRELRAVLSASSGEV